MGKFKKTLFCFLSLISFSVLAETSILRLPLIDCKNPMWKVSRGVPLGELDPAVPDPSRLPTITLPPGSRVLHLGEKRIALLQHPYESLTQGTVGVDPTSVSEVECSLEEYKALTHYSENDLLMDWSVFFEDALRNLMLAKHLVKIYPKALNFKSLHDRGFNLFFEVEERIKALDLETQRRMMEKFIMFQLKRIYGEMRLSFPVRGRILAERTFSIFNPVMANGQTYSTQLEVIALKKSWFQNDAGLLNFYHEQFAHEIDPHLNEGESGEVVSFREGEDNSEFLNYLQRLKKLKDYVTSRTDIQDDAANWIRNLDMRALSKKKVLLFISDRSWEKFPSTRNNWAEFIPLDQSLGRVPADYAWSVMIHEMNMGAGATDFFPTDTHMSFGNVEKATQHVLEGNHLSKFSFETTLCALQLNPSVATVTTTYYLSELRDLIVKTVGEKYEPKSTRAIKPRPSRK